MPESRQLTVIKREAAHRAIRAAMRRFRNDRARVAEHFGLTRQGLAAALARK
jgi:hypothetical protein